MSNAKQSEMVRRNIDGRDPGISVLMLDHITFNPNPYLAIFARALASLGLMVAFEPGGRPHYGVIGEKRRVLHLNWPSNLYKSTSFDEQKERFQRFETDLISAKKAGWRIVWTVHNLIPHDARFPEFERWATCRLTSICDWQICHSHDTADRLCCEHGASADRLSIIPHPNYQGAYPNANSRSVARRLLGISADDIVLLAFGLFRPYKGFERLATFFARERPNRLRLIIAGSSYPGASTEPLLSICSSSPNIDVRFENVDPAMTANLFGACNVTVLPYLKGTTSGVAVLSQSFGRAILAPDFPAFVELIWPGTGLLFDCRAERGLEEAILNYPYHLADEMGRRGQEVSSNHTWESLAERVRSIYTNILPLR
jgi:beta-1,4-mannosyltransferase